MRRHKTSSYSTDKSQSIPFTWCWRIILFAAFGTGGFLLWFFNLPYDRAHEVARWLSRSHKLNSFTVEVFKTLQPFGWALAGALLAVGAYLLIQPIRTRRIVAKCIKWIARQFRRLPGDCRLLGQEFRPHKAGWFYLIVVLLLMCAAVLVRFLFLSYPMRYDESYTVVTFAMRPWLNLVTDYSLPNNHIFHTILVKLSMNLFGTEPWAVRIPAFVSGILCVPAGYILARQLYGREPAVLSAGLIAAYPMLISYSTNARGYSQYILLSLILFSLAIYLNKHANLAGWILFILFSTAGFYTVPFMLFPFGGICLWLVVSALTEESKLAYGSFLGIVKYLFFAGILIVMLTFLLYLPVIIIGTGLDSLVGNPFVAGMGWADFWPRLGLQSMNTWAAWNFDLPIAIQILLAAGVLFSLVFHRKISRVKIPTQITTFIWILGSLILLRRDPVDRLWVYVVPFWLIWACSGLVAPLTQFKIPWKRFSGGLVAVYLAVTAGWSVQRVHTYFPGWQADPGKTELAAEFLSQNLVEGDAVAVIFPDDAIYWYYLGQNGISDEFMHQIEMEAHERVFVVVNTSYDETPALVLQSQNLVPEEYQVENAQLVYEINDQEIYLCYHR